MSDRKKYKVGDKVKARWENTFLKAKIQSLSRRGAMVVYEGYESHGAYEVNFRNIEPWNRNVRVNFKRLRLQKAQQEFAYIAVLDFEATCNEPRLRAKEVIEFPVIVLELTEGQEVARFHEYVLPVVNPILTPFCTNLTGITQEMVQDCDTFQDVWSRFSQWMQQHGFTSQNTIFLTCGDWDLKTMFPAQCRLSGLSVPGYFKKWINIKRFVTQEWGIRCKGMMNMLGDFGIEHVGRHHSGIDDVRNIASCVQYMFNRGVVFRPTWG